MRQFYETYRDEPKLSPLVRELSWTNNLLIQSRSKGTEEREFYLRLAVREKWSSRELERQLSSALFDRAILNPPKVSALLTQFHEDTASLFKDTYLLDFLDLPEKHAEADLQHALAVNLRRFLLELGRDFSFEGHLHQAQSR
jgi:predicted nuclease of restriction endonuclease-like (RecB) superfamily